jgi:hypothetical protein
MANVRCLVSLIIVSEICLVDWNIVSFLILNNYDEIAVFFKKRKMDRGSN